MNNRISEISLGLIAFFMPLNTLATSVSIIILGLSQLLKKNSFNTLKNRLKEERYMSLMLLFFFIKVVGLAYTESENLSAGYFHIQKNLPFLVFPLFIRREILSKEIIKKIFALFVLGTCLAAFYTFAILTIDYFTIGINYYHNVYQGRYFLFHPPYAGLYANVSTVFLLFIFLNDKNLEKKIRPFLYFVLVFLSLFIFVSGNRIQLLSLILIIAIYLLRTIFVGKGSIKFGIASVVLFIFCSIVFLNHPLLKKKINHLQNIDLNIKTNQKEYNGVEIRIVKWKCALQVVQENLLFGVGTGDSQQELNESYKRNGFWGHVFSYNEHNDFLSSLIKFGIFGFSIHILLYLIPFVKGIQIQFYLLPLLVLLFTMSSLTESILARSSGIIIVSFYLCILYNFKNVLVENQFALIREAVSSKS